MLDTPPHLSSLRSDIFRLHRLTELLALSQGQLLVNVKWPAPASGSAGSCAPRLLESPAAALRPFLPAPPLQGLPPSNTFTDSHEVSPRNLHFQPHRSLQRSMVHSGPLTTPSLLPSHSSPCRLFLSWCHHRLHQPGYTSERHSRLPPLLSLHWD